MGPVRGTMVQTTYLCDPADENPDCVGWAVDGGIEQRCMNPIHQTRSIDTPRAALAAGISYRRLDHWIVMGWIRCENPKPGSGRHRHLTESEAAVARLMAVLCSAGVQPITAARLARNLWDGEEARLTDGLVVAYREPEEEVLDA